MNSPIRSVDLAGRALLVADLILALVALWFVLPQSFVPAEPDHDWSADILPTARYVSSLFALMALISLVGWVSRAAKLVLVVVVALLALTALNDFRLEMQLATAAGIGVTALFRNGRFWLDVAFGFLPTVWLAFHLRTFIWPGVEGKHDAPAPSPGKPLIYPSAGSRN